MFHLLQEVEYHRAKGARTSSSDKFVSVMHDFISVAAYNFSELEDQVAEMTKKVPYDNNFSANFANCVIMYGHFCLLNLHFTVA